MTKFVLVAGFCAFLALALAVRLGSPASAQSATTQPLNSWYVTSTGFLHAYFRVPANRNLKRPGILMKLNGDPSSSDMNSHSCNLRFRGRTTKVWPNGQGTDVIIGVRWPRMASPANAKVTCEGASGVGGVQLWFEIAGRKPRILALRNLGTAYG